MSPDARGDAHAHAGVQPARHPGQLPAHAGLRRQHLQVGQRRGRDGAGEVPLASRSRASRVLDRGRRRGGAGRGPRRRTPRTSTTPSSAATTRMGPARPDHGATTTTPSSTSTRWTTPRSGRRTSSRCARSARMTLNRNVDELLHRERADRLRHRRARRRAGLLRRQDAGRPHVLLLRHPALPGRARTTCSCRSTSPRTRRSRTNQRDGADGLRASIGAGAEPARQLRAVDHRRPAGGARTRRHDEQGPEITGRLTRAADRAHATTTTQAGQRYLLSEPWEQRRPGRQPGRRARRSATAPSRSGWSGTCSWCDDELGQRVGEGLGISADDVRGLPPLADPDAHRGRAAARRANLGKNGPRDVDGPES